MSAESSRTLEFNKADSLKDDKRETSHSDIQKLDACMDAAESLDEKASELAEYSASVVRQAFTQPLDKHLFQSIADITDRILADDSIGRYLIQMTSEESDLWHHSANVGLRSILAAKKILNIQDEQMLRELGIGYFLHDIGMKNTDTSEEKALDLISEPHQELRDKHPELGVELLKGAGQLTGANEIILLQHHLAHGMADGSISNQQHAHDFAQICMLCDIFDDLTVKAPGHQGMALFEALKYIKKNMAHHFSDHILRGFIQMYVNSAEKVKQSAAVAKRAPVKNTIQPITPKVAGSASPEKPDNWKSKNKPSEQLEQVLSSSMSAEEKAEKVVQHSSDLMHEIMDQPVTNKLIEDLSAPIASLTDNILQDQELSISLMHMTSHDYYTYTHCVNVGIKSILIAKHVLGTKDDNLMRELGIGFFLHDIGKSQVDPGILNKPGKLTDAEFEIMKRHPEKGVELLQEANALNDILKITVLQHHEKIDGSGYPFGLKGDQFHEFGQICALADIYDALTAERSYKKGMTPFESLKLMKDKMRHHFDEKLFKSFIQLFVESA